MELHHRMRPLASSCAHATSIAVLFILGILRTAGDPYSSSPFRSSIDPGSHQASTQQSQDRYGIWCIAVWATTSGSRPGESSHEPPGNDAPLRKTNSDADGADTVITARRDRQAVTAAQQS